MITRLRQNCSRLVPVGLIALSMAIMPVSATSTRTMNIELCSEDGKKRTVSIPLEQDDGGRGNDCAKPCHACLSRSKSGGKAAKS